VLKEYMARGNYIYPPVPTMRLTTDIFEYCQEKVPKWNTISISGYHIREKGCSAVQEVAFTLANAIAYVEAALERGLRIDEFAPRLAFFFNGHNNVFQEIAKFRRCRDSPPSAAVPSRSTPTASTRRWRCPPSARRGSRCEPSR
jgi:methylmalonyl-CoA mutase N-terminal domain/subunit